MPTTSGSRLNREQRRAQLVGIGLKLLERVPFHSLSIDDVAEQAGISRSLLFHYFPTKNDYLVAVVRSATEHVLGLTEVPEGVTSRDRTRSVVTALVRYIQQRRVNYVAVIRGAPAVSPSLGIVLDEMRDTLCRRLLTSIGLTDPAHLHLVAARGWLASIEEIALITADGGMPQADVIDFGVETFHLFAVSEVYRHHFSTDDKTPHLREQVGGGGGDGGI